MQIVQVPLRAIFSKAVTLAVVTALCLDPVWASMGGLSPFPRHDSSPSPLFSHQALVASAASSAWFPSRLKTTAAIATFALLSHSVFAQGPAKRPRVERLQVPQAAELGRQNILLTVPQIRQAVRESLSVQNPDGRLESQLAMVEGNPAVFQRYLEAREALQAELAALHNDGKYTTFRMDQIRTLGLNAIGDQLAPDHIVGFPGLVVTDPKTSVQTSEPDTTTPRPANKGFLGWRLLAHLTVKTIERAFTGVYRYSDNQVETAYLREHEKDFEARRAYTRLQQTLQIKYIESVNAWAAYAAATQGIDAQRDDAWIKIRAYEREKAAGGAENRNPAQFLELQRVALDATQAYETARNEIEVFRLRWLNTWADSEETLMRHTQTAIKPVTPVWQVDSELLAQTERVRDTLTAEHAQIRAPQTIALPTAQSEDVLAHSVQLPAVPAQQLVSLDTTDGAAVSNEDVESIFAPVPSDEPLGTSALEDELRLQIQLLEQVSIPLLKIQKEKTWRVGVRFGLGPSMLASLLDVDVRNPNESVQMSLEEMIAAIQLKQGSLEDQIQAERIRVRAEFNQARAERQKLLAELVKTRNQYANFSNQHMIAVRAQPGQPADRVTPALQRERVKKVYAAQLTQAWLARKKMDLYTVMGQQRIRDHAVSLNQRVIERLQTIAPNTQGKPQAGRIIRWVFGPMAVWIASFWPSFATDAAAHTFSAVTQSAVTTAVHTAAAGPVANSAAQVAMQVTFGKYTGGSENTLWGVAKGVLKALHPDQTQFSGLDINTMVKQLADTAGIQDPAHVLAGHTYTIGSFNSSVAQALQGVASPAMTPASLPATPIMQPIELPQVDPSAMIEHATKIVEQATPHVNQVAQHVDHVLPHVDAVSRTSTDVATPGYQFVLNAFDWSTQSPEHLVIALEKIALRGT